VTWLRYTQPEWAFAHVLNVISQHERFVRDALQAILNENGYAHVSAIVRRFLLSTLEFSDILTLPLLLCNQTDFITALLLPLERKLSYSGPQLLSLPPILAHTIYQSLQFDTTLRDKYAYCPRGQSEWQGTSGIILGDEKWAGGWRAAEKHCTCPMTPTRCVVTLTEYGLCPQLRMTSILRSSARRTRGRFAKIMPKQD
jgi:RAD50-interacting protein 1